MSRIGFISDLHIANHKRFGGAIKSGLNERCIMALSVTKSAIHKAVEDGCTAIVLAGDIYDTTRPEPQIIRATQEILSSCGISVLILCGNHDMVSTADGDHSLGPLLECSNVLDVCTSPKVYVLGDVELAAVPFAIGSATDWLPTKLCDASKEFTVQDTSRRGLVTHLGIIDSETPFYLASSSDAVPINLLRALARTYNLGAVLSGNWHLRKIWPKSNICAAEIAQIGCLVPTGFDNPGLSGYGSLVIWDTSAKSIISYEMPGPRFVKLDQGAASFEAVKSDSNFSFANPLFVDWKSSHKDQNSSREILDKAVSEGLVAGGAVSVDDKEITASVRRAAAVAARADSLQKSLSEYIRKLKLPDGVTYDSVMGEASKFLSL